MIGWMRSYLLKTGIFSSSSVIGKPWNGCLTELPGTWQIDRWFLRSGTLPSPFSRALLRPLTMLKEDFQKIPAIKLLQQSNYCCNQTTAARKRMQPFSCWVPPQGSSTEGESGPKIRPKGVVDGQQVNIPVLPLVGPEGRRRLG